MEQKQYCMAVSNQEPEPFFFECTSEWSPQAGDRVPDSVYLPDTDEEVRVVLLLSAEASQCLRRMETIEDAFEGVVAFEVSVLARECIEYGKSLANK